VNDVPGASSRRSASRQGSTGFGGGYDGSAQSDSNYFFIPELGYNKLINPDLSLGVTVYGNGGMNTDYNSQSANPAFAPSCAGAQSNLLFGCGKLGVDLMQLIIAPTAAYKINASNSIGVSPLLAYDPKSTLTVAKELFGRAQRPNLLIKIPGTKEGLPAIEEAILNESSFESTLWYEPS